MESHEHSQSCLLIVDKKHPYFYFRLQLTIDDENVNELTHTQYKYLIMQAITETLGQIGAATTVDLIRVMDSGMALVRVPSSKAEKIWASLTLYGTTPAKRRCAFRVLQASPFLMCLAFNSRDVR
ncbi:ribonuclease P protein subunit p14-like [Physella acuta]|uniref:ribonuclease P protein subunit p14-like n=1 Tax=Physella acuta TaxID=109671 RepID=UPI0027DC2A53|nr:ribonuclease P protein subunit p14-like [Physella acuta]